MTTALPTLHLDDAIAHVGGGALDAWWRALHALLLDARQVSATHAAELSPALVDAFCHGTDDEAVEAWLDDTSICDRIWTVASHCPQDREMVAHLVLAAAQGAPTPIAELLCRDLVRMSAVDRPGWDGPLAATERVEQALELAARMGVRMTPFRDLYDVVTSTLPQMVVAAVCRNGVRHAGRHIGWALRDLHPGDLLILDAGDLYDRQVLEVHGHGHGGAWDGLEVVSGARCRLAFDLRAWRLSASFGETSETPVTTRARRRAS